MTVANMMIHRFLLAVVVVIVSSIGNTTIRLVASDDNNDVNENGSQQPPPNNNNSNNNNKKEHSRHVFVFRHCVRSTDPTVNLFDGVSKETSQYPTDITSYMNVSVPNWETPSEFCTEGGEDHVTAVGNYLIRAFFSHVDTLHVHIVTDTPDRDVQTGRALAEGLAQGARSFGQTIYGLEDLTYDPYLFAPTKKINDADMSGNSNGPNRLCETPNPNRLNSDIQWRLENIVTPTISLHEAVTILELYAGVGAAGSLHELLTKFYGGNNGTTNSNGISNTTTNTTTGIPTLNMALNKIQGPINVITLLTQMVFYTRASNTTPPFLPNMTLDELMKLLAWHYWVRSVSDVGTVEAAMRGSVMVHRILQMVQNQPIQNNNNNNNKDHHVIFIIGHDGSMDSIATALDFTWDLPLPYPSSLRATSGGGGAAPSNAPFNNNPGSNNSSLSMWYATPPASALYWSFGDSFVDMSVLTPMFFDAAATTTTGAVNVSGILETVPAVLKYESTAGQAMEQAVRISANDPVDALRTRMVQVLEAYYAPQAMECYNAARTHYSQEDGDGGGGSAPSPSSSGGTQRPTTIMQGGFGFAPAAAPPSPPHFGGGGGGHPTLSSNHSAPTWPPHAHHPNSAAANNGNNNGNSSSSSVTVVVFVAVCVIFASLLVILRKPISQALGLQPTRPSRYSDMETRHDLDLSMEMT